jgi:hypothetical protein
MERNAMWHKVFLNSFKQKYLLTPSNYTP